LWRARYFSDMLFDKRLQFHSGLDPCRQFVILGAKRSVLSDSPFDVKRTGSQILAERLRQFYFDLRASRFEILDKIAEKQSPTRGEYPRDSHGDLLSEFSRASRDCSS
jgi:hypothetical protein